MSETNQDTSVRFIADIRIVGLNRDKTRKTNGSDKAYQVYFELSGTPPQAWRNILEQEWKVLTPTSRSESGMAEVNIDGRFLVLHSPLQETAIHLPVLKQAIGATNKTFKQITQDQITEREGREDVWKRERKAVDDMAESLHFD